MTTASVVVVGGGVIGCSIAFHLTRRGVRDVLLLDRGPIGSGVTGVCPGGIRQQFEGEADCLLAMRSVRFYERINDILEPAMPFRFERSGYLFLACSSAALATFDRNVSMQNRLGIPSRIVRPAHIHDLVPHLEIDGIVGGSFCPEDGFIEDCQGVANQFAVQARQLGARVRREEVRRLGRSGGTWTIETNAGRVDAQNVVLAAGVDSVALANQIGVSLPIVAEKRRILYTSPGPRGVLPPLVVAFEREVAVKQLANGVFYLGWLRESPDVDDLAFVEHTLQAGATLLPMLAHTPVTRVMGGPYDNTPDRRSVLGPVPGVDGLYLAAGFSGHGFMIAPAVGEALADAIAGRATDLPIADFSLERFSTGRAREGLQI